MELSDFTTEQLQEELNRRRMIRMRERIDAGENIPKYEYVRGIVKRVINKDRAFCCWYWEVEISEEDRVKYDLRTRQNTLKLQGGVFNKASAPKEGDIVILCERITKNRPKFTFSSMNCKIKCKSNSK